MVRYRYYILVVLLGAVLFTGYEYTNLTTQDANYTEVKNSLMANNELVPELREERLSAVVQQLEVTRKEKRVAAIAFIVFTALSGIYMAYLRRKLE